MKKYCMRENLTRPNNSFPAFGHRKTGCYKICAGGRSDFFHFQLIAKLHDLISITNTLKKKAMPSSNESQKRRP